MFKLSVSVRADRRTEEKVLIRVTGGCLEGVLVAGGAEVAAGIIRLKKVCFSCVETRGRSIRYAAYTFHSSSQCRALLARCSQGCSWSHQEPREIETDIPSRDYTDSLVRHVIQAQSTCTIDLHESILIRLTSHC